MVFTKKLKTTTINTSHLKQIKQNIQKQSPHPKKVQIVAVTKTFNFSAILSAQKQQIFNIGESRVQETKQKIKNKKINTQTKIHLIGHLQTNKVNQAVKIYNVIQSVDSIKLLDKINQIADIQQKKQKVFLQINITKNITQKGFNASEIFEAAEHATQLPNIKLCGLMAIGANTNNKEKITDGFYQTKITQEKIQKTINSSCQSLSIGMSQDYILALKAGATHLRLGTILFNNRENV